MSDLAVRQAGDRQPPPRPMDTATPSQGCRPARRNVGRSGCADLPATWQSRGGQEHRSGGRRHERRRDGATV